MTVYAFVWPVDMRKEFDRLSALVTQGLQRDPLNGDVYIFTQSGSNDILHTDRTLSLLSIDGIHYMVGEWRVSPGWSSRQ